MVNKMRGMEQGSRPETKEPQPDCEAQQNQALRLVRWAARAMGSLLGRRKEKRRQMSELSPEAVKCALRGRVKNPADNAVGQDSNSPEEDIQYPYINLDDSLYRYPFPAELLPGLKQSETTRKEMEERRDAWNDLYFHLIEQLGTIKAMTLAYEERTTKRMSKSEYDLLEEKYQDLLKVCTFVLEERDRLDKLIHTDRYVPHARWSADTIFA